MLLIYNFGEGKSLDKDLTKFKFDFSFLFF